MIQIPTILTEKEELSELVKELNNRFDQVAREFNSVTNTTNESSGATSDVLDLTTVLEPISCRYVRLGVFYASNAPIRTLFEDAADGKLKYKDGSGTLTVLT